MLKVFSAKYGKMPFVGICCLIVLAVLWAGCQSFAGSSVPPSSFNYPAKKVWAHRGLVDTEAGIEENSIAAFENALNYGAKGLEIDVFFDFERDRFIISHDRKNFNDGTYLTLSAVMKNFRDDAYYWLDLKNLKDMNDRQAAHTAEAMHALLTREGLLENTIVESQNARNLHPFKQRNMHVAYWVIIHPDMPFLSYWYSLYVARYNIKNYNISSVSMDYRGFAPVLSDYFPGLGYYLFTINDEALIEKFGEMPEVHIILSDRNLYDRSWK